MQDVIGAALHQVGERLDDRPVEVDIPADLPLVPLDFVLVVHVLVNLIDNALKYSPPGSPIDICAQSSEARLPSRLPTGASASQQKTWITSFKSSTGCSGPTT